MKLKKKFAIAGLSTRGIYQFVLPLIGKHPSRVVDFSDFECAPILAGVYDIDQARVREFNRRVGVQLSPYDDLQVMLATETPDVLIVAGPDYTHCEQIIAGLEAGCDVICEKPMVISTEEALRVIDAEERTGRTVKIAFNYRYTPTHQKLKRLILDGKLGKITNIEFTYNLDTRHGSSYFYRWNRERKKSGGLNIHKCCHHFDLINWWLGEYPDSLFAYGALNYFGSEGAHKPRQSGLTSAQQKALCPYFQKHYAGIIDPESPLNPGWDKYNLPYEAQYSMDKARYIYDTEIDIEDTYSAVARFKSGASMIYSCNFSTPWEGYNLGINGTEGRLEVSHHSNPDPTGSAKEPNREGRIVFYPLFGGKEEFAVPAVEGGHGGADNAIFSDLVNTPSANSLELSLAAGSEAGAYAVACGEAVMLSIRDHFPIQIDSLLRRDVRVAAESPKASAPVLS